MKTNHSHKERQDHLLDQIEPGHLVVISTGTALKTQGAQYAPFRPHSNAYYLTGIAEPDVVFFFWKPVAGAIVRAVLFKNLPASQRIWSDSHTLCPKAAVLKEYELLFYWEELHKLQEWLRQLDGLIGCYAIDTHPLMENILCSSFDCQTQPLLQHLAMMRCIKEPQEIEVMAQAAIISAQGHARLNAFWQHSRKNSNESDWELFWRTHCWERGAKQQAYLPIIAAGERSCCLHYHKNNAALAEASWVLVDAGCELSYYASDITRTFFRNCAGTIAEQIYKKLLDIQKQACFSVKIGQSLAALEQQVRLQLADLLLELGWGKPSLEQRLEQTKIYFPHKLGHHIGLDVHDNASLIPYDTPLQDGMVVTIEPGFYCSPLLLPQEHPVLGLGIRIEDLVLVTHEQPVILSADAPKEWDEIHHQS